MACMVLPSLPLQATFYSRTYPFKHDGRFASTCCGGSRCKDQCLTYTKHYVACICQCGMRIFFAIVIMRNWVDIGADAVNDFAQAFALSDPTSVRIDAQYAEWYKFRFGVTLDCSLVLSVDHSLRGHPESDSCGPTRLKDISCKWISRRQHMNLAYIMANTTAMQ
jgi:hypothetical protein